MKNKAVSLVVIILLVSGCSTIPLTKSNTEETVFSPKVSMFESNYPVMRDCHSLHAQFNYENGAIEMVSNDITSLVSIPQMVSSVFTVGTEGLSSDQALEQSDCKTVPLKPMFQKLDGSESVTMTRNMGRVKLNAKNLKMVISGKSKYEVSVTKK
jgi:hypothetical protein